MGLFDAIANGPLISDKESSALEKLKARKPREAKKTSPTQEGLEAVMQWATAAGLDRNTVFAQYGGEKDLVKLKEKLAEIIKGKTNQETGEIISTDNGTAGNSMENNQGVPGGQLLSYDSKTGKSEVIPARGVSAPAANGAVQDPEVEEMLNDIRRKLGISTNGADKPSKTMVEGILRERMLHLQELHYLTERFYKLRNTIENRIVGIDRTWRVLLEDWFDENKPEGKKSIELMYGTVGRRNKPLSIALDPLNQDSFNTWIGAQPEEFKKQYNAQQISYWKWDWEVYKKTLDETSKVPGTVVTPAQKDVFFVGPSIDTVTDKAKKGKEI